MTFSAPLHLPDSWAGLSANTRRIYAADWGDFMAWCATAGVPALPTDGKTVALYLLARAETVSAPLLARRLAAIRAAHRQAGAAIGQAMALDQVWNAIRHGQGLQPKARSADVTDPLRRALAAMPRTILGVRDRALLLIGAGGSLRAADLAAMTLDGPSLGGVHIDFDAQGVTIRVDPFKARREGRTPVVSIAYAPTPAACPVRTLASWLDAAGVEEGPVFRTVDRFGKVGGAIHPASVQAIIGAAAKRIGAPPAALGLDGLFAPTRAPAPSQAFSATVMGDRRYAAYETTSRHANECFWLQPGRVKPMQSLRDMAARMGQQMEIL